MPAPALPDEEEMCCKCPLLPPCLLPGRSELREEPLSRALCEMMAEATLKEQFSIC